MRDNRKRLTLDIPIETHKQVKVSAACRNISMVKWILRAILKEIKRQEKYN